MNNRKSGILLHISSLPGTYGIGEIGVQAHRFIESLKSMGQSFWQILPIGPTGYANSPYQALSSFAGNELLICFESLAQQHLLKPKDLMNAKQVNSGSVDFNTVIDRRMSALEKVADQFDLNASSKLKNDYLIFCKQHAVWLDDYALFRVIKTNQEQRPWQQWPIELRDRQPAALEHITQTFGQAITRIKIWQFLFHHQWQNLKTKARESGIQLIGDLPIFIAHDSADAWCNRDLLELDECGECTVVAGVPPDYFSETGQRWGNPLYQWQAHQNQNFDWWFKRLDHSLTMVDIVRIDHFRGFQAYWEIPATEPTAIHGQWVEAPGHALFSRYFNHNPKAQFIAEDLGIITDAVEHLRDEFHLPGMRVLQFGFDGDADNIHLPANYCEHCVAYTSTHDNDTLRGWLESIQPQQIISKLTGLPVDKIDARTLIKLVMDSAANTVIIPLQDFLDLDSQHRMNTPSTTESNWQWRLSDSQLDTKQCQQIYQTVLIAGRI